MLAVALAAGILAQSVARQLRLPGIVLLLAAGVAMGPDGLGWVDPHTLGEGLFGLIDFGVAVILFEGGAILGAQGLGLALGAELKKADIPVVFLDSDPRNIRAAESAGFPVVFGDALSDRTLQRARIDLVGTAIGATPNGSE